MELSLLCGVKVCLFLYDANETKVIQYQSNSNDDIRSVFKRNINKEFYSNKDVSR